MKKLLYFSRLQPLFQQDPNIYKQYKHVKQISFIARVCARARVKQLLITMTINHFLRLQNYKYR